MPATHLNGKELAAQIKLQLRTDVEDIKRRTLTTPHVVNIMIGKDAGSCTYAKSQQRVAKDIGINYELLTLPEDIEQEEVAARLQLLNVDPDVHGIMIHKPIPVHLQYQYLANCLAVDKDLEGINVANIGRMLLGQSHLIPCTPAAVMEHLSAAGVDLRGKEVVVVGASDIVGKPLSLLLLREMATISLCHIATSEAGHLADHVGRAEVLVVAVGKPHLIKGAWIRRGAVVIDVGINQVEGQIFGDVEFDAACERAGAITPVPGGVGPVTVVMLMRNVINAFRLQTEKRNQDSNA